MTSICAHHAHQRWPAGRLTAHDQPGRAWSPGTSPCGRRDRHPPGLPGVPARDPGVEVRGTGRGRAAGDGRPLVDDSGRDAQAPGLRRGRLVLPVAAWARPAAPVGHGGLESRPRLGLALGRRGHPRAAPDALAGHRGPLPLPGHGGAGRRRPGAAGPAHLARRSGTQPAMDPGPPDRGVRAGQRPCPRGRRAVDPHAPGCHTRYAILGMEVLVSVRHSLLALLSAGPMHGYGLKTEFEAATGDIWPLNVGQVYTTLGRLERDGLVTAEADADGQKVYEITEAGRGELGRWFETPVPREVIPRQELAIKLVFAVRSGVADG